MFGLFLLACLAVISGTTITAESLEAITVNSKLPSPLSYNPTVYDGQDSIYVLGGAGMRDIIKYSIELDQVEVIGQMVDTSYGSAVWGGNGNIYYFGGYNMSTGEFNSEVWGLSTNNPSNNMTVLSNMPTPSYSSSSVWDHEENVYIFGGSGAPGSLNTILKFSTVTHRVEVAAQLPSERFLTTVVWDANVATDTKAACIIGGYSRDRWVSDILKFDPELKTVLKLNAELPLPLSESCTVWTGTEAYIIGGYTDQASTYPPIVRFTPSTSEVVQIEVRNFPQRLWGFGCVFVEKLNRIYIVGGMAGEGVWRPSGAIMYINLDEEMPTTTPSPTPEPGGPIDCQNLPDGSLHPDPFCCKRFYQCAHKVAVQHTCAHPLHFNPLISNCDYPSEVMCGMCY